MSDEKKTGFTTTTGKVTVDADSKTQKEISYESYEVSGLDYPSFTDLVVALNNKGISEDVQFTGEGDKKRVSGTSLVQLLIEGFKRYQYTQAVGKAKEQFNSSPDKTASSIEKELKAMLEHPDATDAVKAQARIMLENLSKLKTTVSA